MNECVDEITIIVCCIVQDIINMNTSYHYDLRLVCQSFIVGVICLTVRSYVCMSGVPWSCY